MKQMSTAVLNDAGFTLIGMNSSGCDAIGCPEFWTVRTTTDPNLAAVVDAVRK